MQKFQVGDLVECIDDSTCGGRISNGKVYTVTRTSELYTYVTDNNGRENSGYRHERFQKAGPMRDTFKAGDRVRLKAGQSYATILPGQVYTVGRVQPTQTDGAKQLIFLNKSDGSESFGVFNTRLELADNQQVTVNVTGTITSRGNGVATIVTEHGIIVVPEKLVPTDPRLLILREIAAEGTSVTNRKNGIRRGDYDGSLLPFLEKINA